MKMTLEIFLHDHQKAFAEDSSRFSAFIGGVGSGKTFAGAAKAMNEIVRSAGLGMVVAPTYTMLRDATMRTLREIAGPYIRGENRGEMRWVMFNGAEVLFRSADNPERLRGPNLSWVWLDEAALCPAMTWPILIGRLRSGGKAGRAWITTTPKGRNWLYDLQKQEQIVIYRAATKDNPFLDPEFVRSLEASYTGLFARQELYGEFVAFEGLVYDEFSRDVHVQECEGPWRRVVAGVDEGYTNPAVILIIGLDGDGRAHVIDEFYRRRVLQAEVVERAAEMAREYSIETFYVDPSAAGLIAEMQSAGLPAQPADNRVREGIQEVKARLAVAGDGRPRLTLSPRAANTAAEFESYVWRQGRDGLKDEPEKANDHAMDALRYALMGVRESGPLLLWGD